MGKRYLSTGITSARDESPHVGTQAQRHHITRMAGESSALLAGFNVPEGTEKLDLDLVVFWVVF